jgi:flagellar biosynthesis/type III secretory pathway M-ring protein FliF/YscJ
VGELLWPVAIVVFVGIVFVLLTRLIAMALSEREAEWSAVEVDQPLPAVPPAISA